MKKKSAVIVFFIYLSFLIFIFGKLPFTFFLQDEWAIFGHYLYWDKVNLNFLQRFFIHEQATHLIPFAQIFSYLEFKAFDLNFFLYGIVSLGLHLLASFLVFYLSHLLTKKRGLSFLAGLLFLINANSHQAVTWLATTAGTVGSTLFLLLSLVFFAKLVLEKPSKRNLIVSLLMFIASLGFKETPLFLFLFLPIFWLTYTNKGFWSVKKVAVPTFLLGVGYFFTRVLFILLGQPVVSSSANLSQPPLAVYGYRLLVNPIKFLAQSIVSEALVIRLSGWLVKLAYPRFVIEGTPDPYVAQTIGADIISLLAAITILGICFLVFNYFRNNKEPLLAKGVFVSLIFIFLSPLPLILIPGKAGYFSLVDGRHLYVTGIFSSILLAIIFYGFFQLVKKYRQVVLVGGGLLIFFISLHALKINHYLGFQVKTARTRKSILRQLTYQYPELPAKTIFYIKSDKPYYGLPFSEKILPFQSGFGQTLLVWYYGQGEGLPACFYDKKYLYELMSEDYQECEGRGFGYFRKPESLREALGKGNFSLEEVIAFTYNSSTNSLVELAPEQIFLGLPE
jgi:hypothetical protein